ncbi:hypothetical protein V1478_005347 [Vespula squamosa]|uniref:Uncharacterized protein n=1 Tax=Vespula squamosa TaxID=30214 RepID=A0ABD2BE25_VESSQ
MARGSREDVPALCEQLRAPKRKKRGKGVANPKEEGKRADVRSNMKKGDPDDAPSTNLFACGSPNLLDKNYAIGNDRSDNRSKYKEEGQLQERIIELARKEGRKAGRQEGR